MPQCNILQLERSAALQDGCSSGEEECEPSEDPCKDLRIRCNFHDLSRSRLREGNSVVLCSGIWKVLRSYIGRYCSSGRRLSTADAGGCTLLRGSELLLRGGLREGLPPVLLLRTSVRQPHNRSSRPGDHVRPSPPLTASRSVGAEWEVTS
jgi:hypothetical protein